MRWYYITSVILPLVAFAKPESFYIKEFCKNANGKMEFIAKDNTRADCVTSFRAYEVDFAKKWYEGIGQSLHYSVVTGKFPGLVLVLKKSKDEKFVIRACSVVKHHGLNLTVTTMGSEGNLIKANACQ